MRDSVWRELTHAGLALHSELSLDAVLRALVKGAVTLADAQHAAVGVLDRSGVEFERSIGRADLLRHNVDAGSGVTLVETIAVRGVPYATVVVAAKRADEPFTDEAAEALSILVEQASVAIENARRYESAAQQLAALQGLNEVADALVGEPDLTRLLRGVTERLRELLDAEAVFAFLPTVDGEHLEIRAASGAQARQLLGFRLPRRGSKTGRVLDRLRSERVDRVIEDLEVYQPLARQMNARTLLIVPVLSDQGAFGAITAVNKQGADDIFSADDQRLAEAFAARVTVAVRLATGGQHDRRQPDAEGAGVAHAGLTSREIDVLRLVAQGMSDAQVADTLVVSQRTIHSHLRSIYRKLQVGSRNEAARWAIEHRLI